MAVKRGFAPKQHVPLSKPAGNGAAGPLPADAGRAPGKRASSAPAPALEEPRRSYAARGIAALLAPVLRPAFRKRAPAAAQLLADWPVLAGPELAARAAPVKFAAGTLTLACSGPVAMELQLTTPAVIQRLNLGLGSAMIERLRFVQQAVGTPPVSPRLAPPRRPIQPPENLPEGALGEALAKLYQGIQTKG